jgi:hypothetical protein
VDDTFDNINSFAMVQGRQGGCEEAEGILCLALKGREKGLRIKHPDTLKATGDIKVVFCSQGRFVEAGEWYTQVHAASRRLLGDSNPDTLLAMVNHPFSLRS